MCTDFFGKEQLFLILEFEFGGSDLENLNGKVYAVASEHGAINGFIYLILLLQSSLHQLHKCYGTFGFLIISLKCIF